MEPGRMRDSVSLNLPRPFPLVQAKNIEVEDVEELPVKRIAKPRKKAGRKPSRTAEREAKSFAQDLLKPNPEGRVCTNELENAYRAWCQRGGVDPLPSAVIAPALGELSTRLALSSAAKRSLGSI